MGERSAAEGARQLIGVTTFFLAITTISTILRIYAKAFVAKNVGIDDWFALLSMLSGIATCVFVYEGVHYSGCNHMVDVAPLKIPKAMMYWKFTELGYVVTTTFVKLSVGFLLLRIIVRRWQALVVYFIMILVSGYSIGYFFFVVFECRPADYFWTRFYGLTNGYCIPTTRFGNVTYGHSAVSVVADWTLALLPIAMVWGLQMNPRTKFTVIFILGLGAIASTAVVIRLPYVHTLVESNDFLYDATNVVLWTIIEPGLGMTAMNLATLRPMFKNFFSRSNLFSPSTIKKFSRGTSSKSGSTANENSNRNSIKAYVRSKGKGKKYDELGFTLDEFGKSEVGSTVYDLESSGERGGGVRSSESRENLTIGQALTGMERDGKRLSTVPSAASMEGAVSAVSSDEGGGLGDKVKPRGGY